MSHHKLVLDRRHGTVYVYTNRKPASLQFSTQKLNELRQYLNDCMSSNEVDRKLADLQNRGIIEFDFDD